MFIFVRVAVIFSIAFSSECSKTYTSIIGKSKLPRKDNRMAVGYNAKTDTILAIGGQINPHQFFKFLVNQRGFIDIRNGSYFNDDTHIYGSAPFYTQINNKLWMINFSGNSFITFNLDTFEIADTDVVFPVKVGPGYACLTSHEHYLFLVGGQRSMDAIQIYDISTGEWLNHNVTLGTGRHLPACIVSANTLFTIGGTTDHEDGIRTIETLDVSDLSSISSQDTEIMDQTLSTPLWGSRAVAYGSEILLIGGYTGAEYVSDIFVINTETKSVDTCGSLAVAAMYTAPIVVDDTLFIFGGYNAKRKWTHWELDDYQYIELDERTTTTAAPTAPSIAPYTRAFTVQEAIQIKKPATNIVVFNIVVSSIVVVVITIAVYAACTKKNKLFQATPDSMDAALLNDAVVHHEKGDDLV